MTHCPGGKPDPKAAAILYVVTAVLVVGYVAFAIYGWGGSC